MKVVWSRNAREELMKIVHFIAGDKPQAAHRWANKVIRMTSRLKRFPKSGRTLPEGGGTETREVIVGSYRIIYKLTSRVTILSVFHGAKGSVENNL